MPTIKQIDRGIVKYSDSVRIIENDYFAINNKYFHIEDLDSLGFIKVNEHQEPDGRKSYTVQFTATENDGKWVKVLDSQANILQNWFLLED